MDRLNYLIFDVGDCPDAAVDQFKRPSEFWRISWKGVWKELKVNRQLSGDELLRHRLIARLFHRDQPVGFQAYSIFNMKLDARCFG